MKKYNAIDIYTMYINSVRNAEYTEKELAEIYTRCVMKPNLERGDIIET